MKTLLSLLLVSLALPVSGQITKKNNASRAGDEIIKQQVEYKDQGRQGENVVWNFGELNPVNPEYKLNYYPAPLINDSIYIMGKDTIPVGSTASDDLTIGIEHHTMYYYSISGDSLLTLGHENPVTLIKHNEPVLSMLYPFNYKQRAEKTFKSEGLYSSQEPIKTEGNINIESDAYGMMILPSKDTLSHVLRIKTVQTILEADSLRKIKENPLHMEIETYRWYAKGYRYPVFETVKSFSVSDTVKIVNFTTAFFYPLQEHYYLADDPVNLAVLDSLWNEKNKGDINNPDNGGGQMIPIGNFAYNYYPNPVETTLNIEYYLEETTSVSVALYDLNGVAITSFPEEQYRVGMYHKAIDCTSLPKGNYILRLIVNNEIINEKILKK